MPNKDIESIKGMKDDDRNLKVAGRNWDEPIDDPAIRLLKKIREDVEED